MYEKRRVNDAKDITVYSAEEIDLDNDDTMEIDRFIEHITEMKEQGATHIAYWGNTDYDSEEIWNLTLKGLLYRKENPAEIQARLSRVKQSKLQSIERERNTYERLRKIYEAKNMEEVTKIIDSK